MWSDKIPIISVWITIDGNYVAHSHKNQGEYGMHAYGMSDADIVGCYPAFKPDVPSEKLKRIKSFIEITDPEELTKKSFDDLFSF